MTDCDGSAVSIIQSTRCDIKVSLLKAAPFNLPWGASVHAKVIATNAFGDSLSSEAGNGAFIITYADSPKELAEIVSQRTSTSISFSWVEGAANGGNSVIDYRVSFDNAVGNWVNLASGLTDLKYTA